MSCRSWVASCPLFFLCHKRVGVIADLSRWWMMSLFRTIIAAGVGTCWISGSVCWRKRGCVADPLKGARGLFCVLNCVFQWGENCGISSWSYFFFFFKETFFMLNISYLSSECSLTKYICAFGCGFDLFKSACAGMQTMWKDEVRWVERRVCFQECQGQSGECAPCRPPFSLCCSSVTVYPLRPAGEAAIFSFLPLQGAAVASPSSERSGLSVLEALIGLSCTLHSLLLTCAYHTISSPCCVSPTAWATVC